MLGTELVVPTLEGNVRLKIPPGTPGGQRFRLRGRGLPGASGKRGDLYVVVQINAPRNSPNANARSGVSWLSCMPGNSFEVLKG